jgi:hypothetical protein
MIEAARHGHKEEDENPRTSVSQEESSAILFLLCNVQPIPTLEVGTEQLLNCWKNICASYSRKHH